MTFELTETAQTVLKKRKYFIDDEKNWDNVSNRLSSFFASDGKETEDFYGILSNVDFLPNSPVIMNAGTRIHAYSACYVLGVEDSIESIFDFYKDAALISKSGGGVGANYSKIRPANSQVQSTKSVASGPLSFMEVQDKATDVIKQGGKRRGANMGVLHCEHDDVFDFVKCKEIPGYLENFNLSVGITNKFMSDKEKDGRQKDLWDLLIQKAWKSAEPGVLFLDRIEKDNLVPHLGKLEATNPCGEQALLPGENCCLGSINLSNMVTLFTDGKNTIDKDKLRNTVETSTLFLNRVLDMSEMPTEKTQIAMERTRKIGLGIMGLHDMLIQLDVCYDTKEGRDISEDVMSFILNVADKTSTILGKEEGLYDGYVDGCPKRRNVNLTTIAPTGTLSMIADCSSGVEPYYSTIVVKHVLDGEKLILVNKWFEKLLPTHLENEKSNPLLQLSPDEVMAMVRKEGTIDLPCVPNRMKELFKSAGDISPEHHVLMQAAMQKFVDSSISKTINMPADSTIEDVRKVYELAYTTGCKGVTVYRDGCRGVQVLHNTKEVKEEQDEFFDIWGTHDSVVKENISLPSEYPMKGIKIKSEGKKWYVHMAFKDRECQQPFAIFVQTNAKEKTLDTQDAIELLEKLGKKEGIGKSCLDTNIRKCRSQTNVNKIARTLGLLLRHNVSIIKIVETLDKVDVPISSFIVRIKKLLSTYISENDVSGELCPECSSSLIYSEGCKKCPSCNWNKCG